MKFVHAMRVTKARLAVLGIIVATIGANAVPAVGAVTDYRHNRMVNSADYQSSNGFWKVLNFPAQFKVNAIHAAVLNTGKVLIVAGSGNNQDSFDAGTFRTVLFDPAKNTFKLIATPEDMFCSGHAFLPDGRLLIAGGTQRFEVLKGQVTRAGGPITVSNESPDSGPLNFKKGQRLIGPNGKAYRFTNDFVLPPAQKMIMAGGAMVTASRVVEFAEAVDEGPASVSNTPGQYEIEGLKGEMAKNVYGQAQKMTLDKQDFQGTQQSYLFDPATEKYDRVDDMTFKRWYPTLVGLGDGSILASSGLDGTGEILNGQTEIFNPQTLKWREVPKLTRYFPTYPSLFLLASGQLFYSGSNSGYGPADKGRQPGIWDLPSNTFKLVPGLRQQDLLETSGSVLLPPAQSQKVLVAGGGGVGESPLSASRTDVVDLKQPNPAFVPGPDLAEGTRYPNVVIMPDDQVLITGGSKNYRGKNASDNHLAYLYNSSTNSLRRVADPNVGRDYHSEALLLPDGRVLVLGSNPLFADKKNTQTAAFEQRMEIFTPPDLFHGPRPVIASGPWEVHRDATVNFAVPNAGDIATAKLIRPSAATHVTDVEQRSVALDFKPTATGVVVTVPGNQNLLPAGWYMMFVTNKAGVPSVARWVHVA